MGDAQMGVSEWPLVSVVTPVYNGEPYLVECIESATAASWSCEGQISRSLGKLTHLAGFVEA